MIYLDNSATTYPKPRAVIGAVTDALNRYSANPGRGGHAPSVRAAEAVFAARRNIVGFFDIDREENVIFTPSCTAALNTVIKGILKQGDHVVISSLEHNAVLRPLESLRERGVITYSVADVSLDDDETIVNFRRAINQHTRMMICTHASNVFGTVLPVSRLCALAHANGIAFCLDAAQSAGVLPLSVSDDGYDFVCCAGHKGLYGPMGTGLLLINSDQPMRPLIEGGTGSESDDPRMPEYLPDRLESGTLNVPGILGLSAGVSFVRERGRDRIYRHESELMEYLRRSLREIKGVRLYPEDINGRAFAPVLSFTIGDTDSERAASYLDKKYGIAVRAGLHCAALAHRTAGTLSIGTVRISPSVFTTRGQIDTLIAAVRKITASVQ